MSSAEVTINEPSVAVYASDASHWRLGAGARLLAAGIASACLALLLVALYLPPDPSGLGTHRRLGLPECGFLERTGLPCPSCGMTTSFSWFVRGNLLASIYVQPMGAALAALCGMAVWACMYIAVTGQPIHRVILAVGPKYLLVPLLTLAIAAWGWKMFIHLRGIDGWK